MKRQCNEEETSSPASTNINQIGQVKSSGLSQAMETQKAKSPEQLQHAVMGNWLSCRVFGWGEIAQCSKVHRTRGFGDGVHLFLAVNFVVGCLGKSAAEKTKISIFPMVLYGSRSLPFSRTFVISNCKWKLLKSPPTVAILVWVHLYCWVQLGQLA